MAKIGEYEFTIDRTTGEVDVDGVLPQFWKLIYDAENCLVLRVPAHRYYQDRGQWGYAPVRYVLMRVRAIEGTGRYTATKLCERTPGARWITCVAELKAKADTILD